MTRAVRMLSAADVRRCLTMPEAIARMRDAFARLSSGAATVPVRTRIEAPEAAGRVLVMPAYVPAPGAAAGVKVVSVFDRNAARGLPLIHGVVLLVDPETGAPTALIDAAYLTALRTGAASGLATDLLARPDATCLAVFGAGAQARTQAEAVRAVRPIRRVLLWGRDAARTARFAAELAAGGLTVETGAAPERLREADVICTATTSPVPVFRAEHVAPGAHVNGTGSYRPDERELPGDLIRSARVIVDHRQAALAEAGDVAIPIAEGALDASRVAELGEIVVGTRPGRASPDEITVFKSVGNAVQDVVAAQAVFEAAERLGAGTAVRLGDS